MIVLFTDFGLEGPYTGQIKAVLHQAAPFVPVIDLFADAPTCNARAAAYLLAAYAVSIRASVGRARRLPSRLTGAGMWAPTTASSSW